MRFNAFIVGITFIANVILFVAGFSGCDSTVTENSSDNHISFSALAVGQQSRYIRFTATTLYTEEIPTVTYQQDTLLVTVVSAIDSGFVFQETMTPGSISIQNDSLYVLESASYHVAIRNDELYISALSGNYYESNLFLIRHQPLLLGPIQENRMELAGVKVVLEAQDLQETGYLLHHEQFKTIYPHLNLIKDWSATAVDGPGYTMVYSPDAGIVRTFTTSAWTGTSVGWDLFEF